MIDYPTYEYFVSKLDQYLRDLQHETMDNLRREMAVCVAREVERIEHQTVAYLKRLLDQHEDT